MWFETRMPMEREVIPLAKREVSMVFRRRLAEAEADAELLLLLGLLAPAPAPLLLPMLEPLPAYLAALLLASKELAALLPLAGKSWLASWDAILFLPVSPDEGVLAFRRLVDLR